MQCKKHCNQTNYILDSIKKLKTSQSHFSIVYKNNNGWTKRFNTLGFLDTNKTGLNKNKNYLLKEFSGSSIRKEYEICNKKCLNLKSNYSSNLKKGLSDEFHK